MTGTPQDPPEAPSGGGGEMSTPPPRKRLRWRTVLLWTPLFLITALVLTIAELPYLLTPETVRTEGMRAITDALGVAATIDRVDYHPLTGIELFGVRIGPPEGFEADVFSAKRVALRYDLGNVLSEEVRITEVALDDPVVTFETRGGRTNVDAILAHLNARFPPGEPASPSAPGPLVPVKILLDRLAIGPLRFHVVGDGPNAEIDQVWLEVSGRAGPETLALTAQLEARAAPPGAVQVHLPPADGQPKVDARGDLALTLDAEVEAETHLGLALTRLDVALAAAPRFDVTLGEDALPTLRAPLGLKLSVAPGDDTVALTDVRLDLADAPMVRLSGGVRGVHRALESVLGPVAGPAALSPIGWPSSVRAPEVWLDAPRVEAPLGALAPYVRVAMPGLSLDGALGMRGLKVEGSPVVLQDGLPAVLEGELAVDQVSVRWPAQGLSVSRLDGGLTLGRDEGPEGAGRIVLGGGIDVGAVRVPGTALAGGRIGLEGFLPRLGYPLGGLADLTLRAAVRDVDAPPATLARAALTARLSGTDPLLETRTGAPLVVQVDLQTEGLEAATGSVAPYRVPTSTFGARATLDRLLVPTEAPIAFTLSADVPGVTGPDGLALQKVRLASKGLVSDPRRGFPKQVGLATTLSVAGLRQADARVQNLKLQSDLRTSGRALGGSALGRVEVPERADLAATLTGDVGGAGDFEGLRTGLSSRLDVTAWPASQRVRLRTLRLDLDEALAVSVSGRVRRAFEDRRHAKLDLRLERLSVGGLLERAPRALLGELADLQGRGELKGDLHFDGRPADLGADLDLRTPPVGLDVDLRTDGLGLTSTTAGFRVVGLSGRTKLRLAEGGTELDNRYTLAEAVQAGPEARRSLYEAGLLQHLGYEDGAWRLDVDVDAERLEGARGGDDAVSGLAAELVARYPPGGTLDVPRLRIEARSAGVELDGQARLSRGPFGVIVPEFQARGRILFDRLRAVLPEVGALSGGLEGRVQLAAEDAAHLALGGEVRLDALGYQQPNLEVVGAFGRVPLDQAIVLPEPVYRANVAAARGQLGDDLEARLAELQARLLQAQGLLSNDDVILVPPRHADHEALRPYRRVSGSDLRIARVRANRIELSDVIAEAQWTGGQLRLDHFEASLWGGEVLADFALQVTPTLDVRARTRGTVTNLNMDVPFALVDDRAPEEDDRFVSTATLDLSFALQERVVNGRIQVTKLSIDLVKRALVTVASAGPGVLTALSSGEFFGVRPTGAQVWISENLLNAELEWQTQWLRVRGGWWALAEPVMWPLRNVVLIPTLGSNYVIPTVNGAIKRLSLSGFIDQALDAAQPEVALQTLTPHVRADPDDGS